MSVPDGGQGQLAGEERHDGAEILAHDICTPRQGADKAPPGRSRRSRRGRRGGDASAESLPPNALGCEPQLNEGRNTPERDYSPCGGAEDAHRPLIVLHAVLNDAADIEVRHFCGAGCAGQDNATGGAGRPEQDQVQIKLDGQVLAGQTVSRCADPAGVGMHSGRLTVALPATEESRWHRIEARVRCGGRGPWSSWSRPTQLPPTSPPLRPVALFPAAKPPSVCAGAGGGGAPAAPTRCGQRVAAVQTELGECGGDGLGAAARVVASAQTHVSLDAQAPLAVFARRVAEECFPCFEQATLLPLPRAPLSHDRGLTFGVSTLTWRASHLRL